MLSITIRNKKLIARKATKIINLGALKKGSLTVMKEDPLEAIIRTIAKPISLKERVAYDPEVRGYIYHPSHAYFEYMSKMHPLTKPK